MEKLACFLIGIVLGACIGLLILGWTFSAESSDKHMQNIDILKGEKNED